MKKTKPLVLIVTAIAIILVVIALWRRTLKGDALTTETWPDAPRVYSIGVLAGSDPFSISNSAGNFPNPALSARDVSDVPADFVADPFMIRVAGVWYMFFEVMNAATSQGDIGLATSRDGFHWKYDRIALDEPFHLSYPCVFEWQGSFYMIPESYKSGAIRLYEASDFPRVWQYRTNLVEGVYVDPTIFRHAGAWWIYTTIRHNLDLHLFYSKDLFSGWKAHPMSPVIQENADIARQGGRSENYSGNLLRIAQDCLPTYGNQVRAFRVEELTPTTYRETEPANSPILTSNLFPWVSLGMHHMDAHRLEESNGEWIACVDGCAPARPDMRLDIKFASGERLMGMTMRPSGAVTGDKIRMRFFWKNIPSDLSDKAMFVHFVRKDEIVAQGDYNLTAGVEFYENVATIPRNLESGVCRIVCGLYNVKTGERYPVKTRLAHKRNAVRLPVKVDIKR